MNGAAFRMAGIEIVEHQDLKTKRTSGWWNSIARFKQGNVTCDHHELGEFHKVNGPGILRWPRRNRRPSTKRLRTSAVKRSLPCAVPARSARSCGKISKGRNWVR